MNRGLNLFVNYCVQDELLWAAAWLFKASSKRAYLRYVRRALHNTSDVSEFTWDNKGAGVAVLLSSVISFHLALNIMISG